MGTYQRRFESLLHFEEIQMEVDIRKYDMDEVTMTTCPDNRLLLVLQVFIAQHLVRWSCFKHRLMNRWSNFYMKKKDSHKCFDIILSTKVTQTVSLH